MGAPFSRNRVSREKMMKPAHSNHYHTSDVTITNDKVPANIISNETMGQGGWDYRQINELAAKVEALEARVKELEEREVEF